MQNYAITGIDSVWFKYSCPTCGKECMADEVEPGVWLQPERCPNCGDLTSRGLTLQGKDAKQKRKDEFFASRNRFDAVKNKTNLS
jgi:DNA-directed RNA polymerase subunit RPC12/RpoP